MAQITVLPTTLPNTTSTLVYNRTLSASGGTAPYTFAVTSGALPAGVTLSGNTLSGIPTQLGSFTFTITATDAALATGSRVYTITVSPPVLTIAAISALTVGTFSSQQLTTSASPIVNNPTYTYVVTAGALPPGMTLQPGGFFSGTPTAGGTFNFTLISTDNNTGAGPYSTTQSFTLTVDPPSIIINPFSLGGASPVVAYSATFSSFNGTAPYTYAITAGALPPGLTLSPGGTISGTATQLGPFTFTVTSTDNSTGTGPFTKAQSYSILVSPPLITLSSPLPAAQAGAAYSVKITASGTGTTAPYTFAQTGAGTIPPGLTIAADGTLSGTPTKVGSYAFQIRATDNSPSPGPYGGTKAYLGFVVSAPTIVVGPATLPDGTAGVAYSQTIAATGGTAPYTYAVTAGALPPGVTLSSGGVLSGTSNVTGSYSFTVTATDATTGTGAPYSASTAYTLNFVAPTIALAPILPQAKVGVAYSQSATASGGTGPYTYGVTAGSLPAGLSLAASTGAITGTPTAGGAFNFTVTATDANAFTGSQAYAFTVNAPTQSIQPLTLTAATVGIAYNQTMTVTGGTAPYTFQVSGLPAGLTLTPGGILSGTPTEGGTFSVIMKATDNSTGTGPYLTGRPYTTFTVNAPTITLTPSLPSAIVGFAYNQTITASGGTSTYTYAVTAGVLPAGLTLASDGTLSGTPTAGGTFNFTVTATDNSTGTGPYTGSQAYTFTVTAPLIAILPSTLSAATVGTPYSATLSGDGGTPPYTFAITSGALPAGLTLASDGTLSGTPTAGGTFTLIKVTATDNSTGTGPYSTSRTYLSFTVNAPNITLSPATLAAGTAGVAYSQSITASGGTSTYTFALTAGALPPGLTLASDGTLSGAPTASGTFNFTISATDSSTGTGPYTSSTTCTLTIGAPTIVLSPTTLPATTVGIAYNQSVSASGGTTPYTYAITAGALPAGLTLSSSTGAITGTPTAGGTSNFTVTATDANSFTAAQAYTFTTGQPTITLAPATLPGAAIGAAYSGTITASGGTAPYTYAVSAGALPAGMTLSSTGVISGTPTAAGTFNFTVTATDASIGTGAPYTASLAYSIIVGKANQTIAFAGITATYGDAPVTLTGTASSGLGVTYVSSDPSVATVSGSTLTILSAGTATITASQAGDANYNAAADVTKALTVNAKAIAITANTQTKVYGVADPALTYNITSGGLVGTDAFTGTLTRDAGEAVNTYAIKQGTLALNSNYTVTYTGANLTITPANLTVKADDQTRAYNAANPAFTVSYTGFVNGDTEAGLTAKPTVSTTATATSAVGTYPLTAAGAAFPNYTITYSQGTLTITQAVLTVTADNKSRNYGDPNPAFTLSYSGFINGDDASKLTTTPVAASASTAATAPGNYPITISGGVSADYTFNYVPGILTIIPLTDAGLISLTTSAGSLSPGFDAGTFTYNVQVENTVNSLSLTPTFTATASATVNGTAVTNGNPSSSVPLSVGNNVITLVVTAQDGVTKKTYILNVYRGLAPTSITSNNILTPNGDGKNDFWVIKDIQLYPNNTVTVYDSGGRSVFSKRGYNNDWGGTINDSGAPLAGGTYYYTVDLGIGENAIKGYISIIRSK